jgi:hypothetical protein
MNLDRATALEILQVHERHYTPARGVHIKPDGSFGRAQGVRYVDLDSPDKKGWTIREWDVVELDDGTCDIADDHIVVLESKLSADLKTKINNASKKLTTVKDI